MASRATGSGAHRTRREKLEVMVEGALHDLTDHSELQEALEWVSGVGYHLGKIDKIRFGRGLCHHAFKNLFFPLFMK